MADGQHGGYRAPSNPAQVSGPGKYSARTDGQPAQYISGESYGEGQALMDMQRSAPMAAVQGSTPTPSAPSTATITPMTPFDAPTTAPDEPWTTGSPFGAGPGPEVLPRSQNDPRQKLRRYLPVLVRMADLPETSEQARAAIRYLRGVL